MKINECLSYLKEDIGALTKMKSLPDETKNNCLEILTELDGLEKKLRR